MSSGSSRATSLSWSRSSVPVLAPAQTGPGRDDLTDVVDAHIGRTFEALSSLQTQAPRLALWGSILADRLSAGQRLLVAGNGGSAAEAQHLTAELVGRFDGDRPPFSAIALHAETSALTAVANDYGYDEVFSRQVRAHGRPGDIL
ncbi:MAG: SIS domain-containing protein, partial [Actinobacteria bacterium]|nr:SIS domain-containing protein [Actinomycetota bacterium]